MKVYGPGDIFGELALLYNSPRAATIISTTKCILYSLDRETFNIIVKDTVMKTRKRYEQLLDKVEILSTLSSYEKTQICDALKPQYFKKGQEIVKEGDYGDKFYILEEGEAFAGKTFENKQEKVLYYQKGDYFGEVALIKNVPRAASIIANTDVKVVYLERPAFKRMVGSVEVIMKRNFKKYEKYM